MSHPMASRHQWLAARTAHLVEEKAFTKARDALAAGRRAIPWLRVEKPYRFQTPEGERTLSELFGPHSQLIVNHFMFGPDWDQGCPSCSFWANVYDGIAIHLAHRDAAFVTVSNTALDKIERYRARMGWRFRWASSLGSDFNRDFGVTFTADEIENGTATYNYTQRRFPSAEAPGISIFHKPDPKTIVHTYSTYGRGLDITNAAYHLMDMLPKGRDEAGLGFTMAWLRGGISTTTEEKKPDTGAELMSDQGTIHWSELITGDVAAAKAFFKRVAGWQGEGQGTERAV